VVAPDARVLQFVLGDARVDELGEHVVVA